MILIPYRVVGKAQSGDPDRVLSHAWLQQALCVSGVILVTATCTRTVSSSPYRKGREYKTPVYREEAETQKSHLFLDSLSKHSLGVCHVLALRAQWGKR